MVVTTDHMGDLHQDVVDRDREVVQRIAVGPHDHEVGDVGVVEDNLAADGVADRRRAGRHPEPHDGLAPLGPERLDLLGGEIATATAVTGRQALGTLGFTFGVQLFLRAVAVVRRSVGEEPLDPLVVDRQPFALLVRAVLATDLRPFVPVEAEPAEVLDRRGDRLVAHPGPVGVLDPEDEPAAGVPRPRPGVQRGPHVADGQVAARRGSEPRADRSMWAVVRHG